MAGKRPRARPSSHAEHRAALFAAVKEAPEDVPRLVLADWLEEHGDETDRAHAELIRLQCEALRLSANLIAPKGPDAIHALLWSAGYHTSVLPYPFTRLASDRRRGSAGFRPT